MGTCPNIEVEVMLYKNLHFLLDHIMLKKKMKLYKTMKRLCFFSILKEGFSAYSSQVMLISRKGTQEKRVVTDFRHLNIRIAKNTLAYILPKDIFLTLGSFRCELLLYNAMSI